MTKLRRIAALFAAVFAALAVLGSAGFGLR
jgi:hypothetical protein